MLNINEKNQINAKEIYSYCEVKTPFHKWIKYCIEIVGLNIEKDFWNFFAESTGGRPAIEYLLTIDAAKEICIVSATKKSKELRRWLISLSNKVENLELISVKQAAFAFKVINCFKYISEQQKAYSSHQTKFIQEYPKELDSRFIYQEFAKFRSKITGWTKEQTNQAIDKYISEHVGYNKRKLKDANMSTQLSVIDIGEAIRVACLDILYSKDSDENIAHNFANLCKRLANEMEVKPEKQNLPNLFHEKEAIENINLLSLE